MLQPPALGLIMVGDRKDSALYVKNKQAACRSSGIRSANFFFDDSVSQVLRCCSSVMRSTPP
jgi:5,10-methylene-tetrahydrofolate dehydrogenase/methenyl tetrahydrofolate cyclohydrolase